MKSPTAAELLDEHSSLRIAVISGGNSAERTISLQSGLAVAKSLRSWGHAVSQLDPAKRDMRTIPWLAQFDCAFIALHGSFGEDGQIQTILEAAGMAYTGSDSVSSRAAFSKSVAKQRFQAAGVPTPEYRLIQINDDRKQMHQQARQLGFPLAVKPDSQGSSLGVSIIESPAELDAALDACFQMDEFGILEAAILGTEWTLGMLDDLALPLIKIETDRGFYDFRAKYQDDVTRYLYEFEVSAEIANAITDIGRQACSALGTRGLARVDLRVDEQHRPWVLEVNTIPGLTDHSLIPKAATRAGIEFEELCDRVVRAAIASHADETPVEQGNAQLDRERKLATFPKKRSR